MDSKTVKLKEPIQHGSDTITELTLRKPKAKDFRKLPLEPNFGDILDLIARLAGQPPSVIDEMAAEDLTEVADHVAGFMPAGLGTGTKASQ